MAKKTNGKNGHGKPGHNSIRGTMRLYRSYNFVDKDPAIDKLRTVMKDEGIDYHDWHILSGVGAATFRNWFDGDTKRPQHATLAAAAASLGYDWELTHARKVNYGRELPKAQREMDEREANKRKIKT